MWNLQFQTFSAKGKRAHNEDAVYPVYADSIESSNLFLVADGVGGLHKGEIASKEIVNFLVVYFRDKLTIVDSKFIASAIKAANLTLDAYCIEEPLTKGMATTLALLHFAEKEIWMAHVGDSRIYQLRNGQIIHRTTDHSLVNEMVENGKITLTQATNHPQKNVITRALIAGNSEKGTPEIIRQTNSQKGDLFFLCSDGVLEGLEEFDLIAILSNSTNSIREKRALIENACRKNASDNYTGIIVELEGF